MNRGIGHAALRPAMGGAWRRAGSVMGFGRRDFLYLDLSLRHPLLSCVSIPSTRRKRDVSVNKFTWLAGVLLSVTGACVQAADSSDTGPYPARDTPPPGAIPVQFPLEPTPEELSDREAKAFWVRYNLVWKVDGWLWFGSTSTNGHTNAFWYLGKRTNRGGGVFSVWIAKVKTRASADPESGDRVPFQTSKQVWWVNCNDNTFQARGYSEYEDAVGHGAIVNTPYMLPTSVPAAFEEAVPDSIGASAINLVCTRPTIKR
jgi:hypothetical protein